MINNRKLLETLGRVEPFLNRVASLPDHTTILADAVCLERQELSLELGDLRTLQELAAKEVRGVMARINRSKSLYQLNRLEYALYHWNATNAAGESELKLLKGLERTPEEALEAAKAWDEWHELKMHEMGAQPG